MLECGYFPPRVMPTVLEVDSSGFLVSSPEKKLPLIMHGVVPLDFDQVQEMARSKPSACIGLPNPDWTDS